MHTLTRRPQVLLDQDRCSRVAAEARRRGQPVAVIVREAIDAVLPADHERRRAALLSVLEAEPTDVPEDPGGAARRARRHPGREVRLILDTSVRVDATGSKHSLRRPADL